MEAAALPSGSEDELVDRDVELVGDHKDNEEFTDEAIRNSSEWFEPSHGIAEMLHPTRPSKYDDFETIDWMREEAFDRAARSQLDQRVLDAPSCETFSSLHWYRGQAWLYLLLVAALTASVFAAIEVSMSLLFSLRLGFCRSGLLKTERDCCSTAEHAGHCDDWLTWASLANLADDSAGAIALDYTIYVVLAGIYAGLASVLVLTFAPYAAGSGIPELKAVLEGFVLNNFISIKTFVVKVIGLIFAVASGLCLGQEGPMAHIGGAATAVFAPLFTRHSENEAKIRELISSGCACGVAVAFGAPIGGVLFSLEELSSYFPHSTMWRAFFCSAFGALILKMIDPLGTGKAVIFQVTFNHGWQWAELPFFLLTGVLGGLAGQLFVKMNVAWIKHKRSTIIKGWPIVEVIVLALLTALLSYFNPFTKIASSEMIWQLFSSCADQPSLCQRPLVPLLGALVIGFILKLALTSLTNGLKLPSGMMVPCLAIGALLGRAVGVVVHAFYELDGDDALSYFSECRSVGSDCVEPGVYALLGAAAVLNGATGITLSLTVICFELTGQAEFIVPIMIAVVGSYGVSNAMKAKGLYDELIEINDYPYLDVKGKHCHFNSDVAAVMTRAVDCLPQSGLTLDELDRHCTDRHFTGFPVVLGASTDRPELTPSGFVSRKELQRVVDQAKAERWPATTPCLIDADEIRRAVAEHVSFLDLSEIVDRAPLQLCAATPIEVAFKMFRLLGLRYVLVTRFGRLQGIVTKKDLIRYHAENMHRPVPTFNVVPAATIQDSGLFRLCCTRPDAGEYGLG